MSEKGAQLTFWRTLAIVGACVVVAFLLSGCTDGPINDVAHYVDRPAERAAKLAECRDSPGTTAIDPNCINADRALLRSMNESTKMPSLR